MCVRVHKADERRISAGQTIRIQEQINGRWSRVLVRRVDSDGYFQADR